MNQNEMVRISLLIRKLMYPLQLETARLSMHMSRLSYFQRNTYLTMLSQV